ncbi:MAG TPA: Wzz/FepE/Etk N-terminal domain-containing protein, partial [Kofleriaceae bacterium]|nr:Wzz/FepE/Etk N-terminal domain-containing protein [Kofleriaceae bacterium]
LTPREQIERLFDLLRRATRYAWLVVLVAVVGSGLSVLLALTRPHQYESETVLLYRELISQSVLQGRDVVQSSNMLSARYKEMLLARSNLIEVVRKFNLFPDTVRDEGEVAAADLLRTRITFRDKGAGTFRIAYRGDSKDEAQKVTEFLAVQLKAEDNRLRREQAQVTKNFLVAEKQDADEELKSRERTLAEFLAKHPEFVTDTTGGSSAGAGIRAAQQKKSSGGGGDPRLSALERQRSRIKARLANPNAPVTIARETSAERRAAEQEIKAAQRDIDEAQRDLTDKLAQYTDKHPDVVNARQRLAAAQQRLRRAEAGLPPVGTEPVVVAPVDKDALERELRKVEREIAQYRARQGESSGKSQVADDVVVLETEWSRLMRSVDEARERVASLEARVFTADITASSEFAEAAQLSVIDKAYLPHRPAGKPRRLLVMFGGLLFTGLGVALALGLALIDDRIYRRYDLERIGVAPVLVVVPGSKKKRKHRTRRRRV